MSLIHWWPLATSSLIDNITGVSLTNNNSATFTNSGKIGGAYSFSGANNCSLKCSWQGENSPYQLSIGFWIKLDSTWSGWGQVLTIGKLGTSWNDIRFGVDIESSRIVRFTVSDGSNATSYSGPYSTALSTGIWYHITITYDNKIMKMYVDGNAVSSNFGYVSSIIPNLNACNISIGGNSSEAGECSICDVRIYDHALSQAEVKDLSKALAVHYTFDDILAEPTTNLVTGLVAGGRTTLDSTGKAITTSGEDADTYFYLNLSKTLEAGKTYTISCTGENIIQNSGGSGEFFQFGLQGQGGVPQFKIYNGRSSATFTATTTQAVSRLLLDDITGARCLTQSKFYDFQLEEKDHATPYTLNTRPSLLQNEVGFNNPITTNNITLSSDCATGSLSFSPKSSGYIEQAVQGDVTHGATASMWIKADLSTNWVAFADYGSQLGFGCYSNYGVIASVNGTNKRRVTNMSSLWKTNDWNHVVVSMSSDNTVNRCWINGTEVTYGSADYWTHTGKFTIGCRYNGSYSMNFPGLIDDFRFYHTCLSDADVKDLYHTKAMISNESDILCGQVVENKNIAQVTGRYNFDTVECNEEIDALYDCLEYLESTGTQYIDTGYVTKSSNYSYEVDIIPTATESFYSYMGFMASSTNPRAGLHEYSGTFMIGANATTQSTGYAPVKDQRVRLKAVFKSGDQRLYKDGILAVSNTTTFDHSANTLSTHIFARNYSSGRNQSKIKLFEALIYEGDYPVRRFIPVRRKSDKVLGLYETFTKTFYANNGTGTFTTGPTLTSGKALISSTHKIGGRNIIER